MVKTKYFLSVDWGTTNFRLRMVDCKTLKIVEELFLQNSGVKSLFDQWKKDGGSRQSVFFSFLKKQIDCLKTKKPAGIPVVISGMASSSLGVIELDYAALPFSTDGKNAVVNFLKSDDLSDFPIFLVSGIKSETDVIRGEETQLIGCIREGGKRQGEQLYIFPGTHSKHIVVKGNKVIDFKTYMTGEFFDLLSSNSVLSNSVKGGGKINTAKMKHSFEGGLKAAVQGNLLNEAFHVRTNYLLKNISAEENYYYLSGLLIGTEITGLPDKRQKKIFLVCGSALYPYYKLAFKIKDVSKNIIMIPPKAADELVIKGQYKILMNNIQYNG